MLSPCLTVSHWLPSMTSKWIHLEPPCPRSFSASLSSPWATYIPSSLVMFGYCITNFSYCSNQVLFRLRVGGNAVHCREKDEGLGIPTVAGVFVWHMKLRADRKQTGLCTLKAHSGDLLPLASKTSLLKGSTTLQKQCHQLGTKCSNTWAYGEHFSFNPHQSCSGELFCHSVKLCSLRCLVLESLMAFIP